MKFIYNLPIYTISKRVSLIPLFQCKEMKICSKILSICKCPDTTILENNEGLDSCPGKLFNRLLLKLFDVFKWRLNIMIHKGLCHNFKYILVMCFIGHSSWILSLLKTSFPNLWWSLAEFFNKRYLFCLQDSFILSEY